MFVEIFNKNFIHSEQTLFYDLENLFKNALSKLIKDSRYSDNGSKYKVKSVILNIHSERYMCENCQNMATIIINCPDIKNELIKILKESNFKVSKNFRIIPVVSATIPYIKQDAKNIDIENYRMTEDKHENVVFDLHRLPKDQLFFKDFSKSNLNLTNFISRRNKDLLNFQNENEELKKKNEELNRENVDLKKKLKKLEKEYKTKEYHFLFNSNNTNKRNIESNSTNNIEENKIKKIKK